MGRAYAHPMLKNNYNQLGQYPTQQVGGMFDFWDEFREETLDPWVEETLSDVGLDQAEIDKLKADAGSAFDQELKDQQQQLIQQITGSGAPAPTPSITDQLTTGFKDLQESAVFKAIPGGIYTVAGVGIGLIAFLALRK